MRGSGSGSAAAAASSSSADIADESGFVFEVAGKLKFQVTEPQRHGGEGKFDTPFWTYKIVCNVRTCFLFVHLLPLFQFSNSEWA